MTVKPWFLVAALVGSSGLAGGGEGNLRTVAAAKAGDAYVVFREAGSVEYGTQKLQIAVYDKKGGRLRWQRQVPGLLGASGNSTQSFPGWGIAGSVLWVGRDTGGENWHVDNLGFRLSDGRQLWENIDVGYPLAVGQGKIFFRSLQSQNAYPDLRQEGLIVNDLKTGMKTRLNLRIPERPNCGNTNDYSFEDAAYLGNWADAKFFYVRRKDACGVFVTRFDWHGSEGQTSTILPE